MKIFDQGYVQAHLTTAECIAIMEQTLKEERCGRCTQYLRTAINMPNTNILGLMPSYFERGYFGAKVISVYHTNAGTGYPSHQGEILLFAKEHGNVLAVIDAMSVTKIRTGCVSRDLERRKALRTILDAAAQLRESNDETVSSLAAAIMEAAEGLEE